MRELRDYYDMQEAAAELLHPDCFNGLEPEKQSEVLKLLGVDSTDAAALEKAVESANETLAIVFLSMTKGLGNKLKR